MLLSTALSSITLISLTILHSVQGQELPARFRWVRTGDPRTGGKSILYKLLVGAQMNASLADSVCQKEGGTNLIIFNGSDNSPEMQALQSMSILDEIWLAVVPLPDAPLTSPPRYRYRWSSRVEQESDLRSSSFWSTQPSARPQEVPTPLSTRGPACQSLAYTNWGGSQKLRERPCSSQLGVICRIEVTTVPTLKMIVEQVSRMSSKQQFEILPDLFPHLLALILEKVDQQEQRAVVTKAPVARVPPSVSPVEPHTGDDEEDDERQLINDLIESTDHRTNHALIVSYVALGLAFVVLLIFFVLLSCLLMQRPDLFLKKNKPSLGIRKEASDTKSGGKKVQTFCRSGSAVEFSALPDLTDDEERGKVRNVEHASPPPPPSTRTTSAVNNNNSTSNLPAAYRTVSV